MFENKKVKNGVIFGAIVVVLAIVVTVGVSVTKNLGKTNSAISADEAKASIAKMLGHIQVEDLPLRSEALNVNESLSTAEELPDIDTVYPIGVQGSGQIDIEVFTSPEKGGPGMDRWLLDVAEAFNKANHTTSSGATASVTVRSVDSGTAVEYISSGKYVPDAFTPSSTLWGAMLETGGVSVQLKSDRLAGNVAGVLLTEEMESHLIEQYGSADFSTVVQATADGEMMMGYTNPYASSTGLNFLLNTLYTGDPENPLSSKAVGQFNKFQANVPLVAFTTMQMRTAAESNVLDGLILEYQSYINDSTLAREYKFIPFGVRHDNPMYAVGNLSAEKEEVLDQFIAECGSQRSQELATKYGFNSNEEYQSALPQPGGQTITQAQSIWKENKDGDMPIVALFIVDISGSMSGEPINNLRTALLNSMQYINDDNYIGLISFSSDVYRDLPIEKFNLKQKTCFKGAVNNLTVGGQTAMYDALTVGMDMVEKKLDEVGNAKPMIFVLTDGESNNGYRYRDVGGIVAGLKIPVYTISYNYSNAQLDELAAINEAASISGTSEDIVYKLRNLFNAQI